MKIYLIFILFFIIILSSSINCYENYYTFFKPFEIKTKFNKNKYVLDTYTFSSFIEDKYFLDELVKLLLTNTEILNLKTIYQKNDMNYLLNSLNKNLIQFLIMPLPLVYLKNNIYKDIRAMINISNITIYMLYNHKYHYNISKFEDFLKKDKVLNIGISNKNSVSDYISQLFLNKIKNKIKNYKLYYDTHENLVKNLKEEQSKYHIILFLDSNPSNKLRKIIQDDYENKIYIKDIDFNIFDFNLRNEYIFNQEYIKFEKPSFHYPNFKYKTISFTNILLTNKYLSNNIIKIILNFILKNKSFINTKIKGYEIKDYNSINTIYKIIPHPETHKVLNNLNYSL